ncbi:MAG: nucleotide-binding protein [Anaerolineae bacterium]|nr:nucleotide-binding protein [Anaerolineae bacterium]
MNTKIIQEWIVDCERCRIVSSKEDLDAATEKTLSLSLLIRRILSQTDDLQSIGLDTVEFVDFGNKFVNDLQKFIESGGKSTDGLSLSRGAQIHLLSLLKTWQDNLNSGNLSRDNKDKLLLSKKVFIVHGRNHSLKEEVARFLEKFGLGAIILHEQPNFGMTIIEKFEAFSDVRYAIVLLTADDIGGVRDTKESQLPRARQNVIFELGYFLGKLGRAHVCALYENGVELPSDVHGVLYVPWDNSGFWKIQIAKEMKHAGLKIDLNLI